MPPSAVTSPPPNGCCPVSSRPCCPGRGSSGNGGGLRRNTFDSAVAIWGGIGAWVDRYDYPSSDPPGLDVMASHGVVTLYLQTGRSSEAVDVLEPGRLGNVLEGAHDRGMKVVAWYAPSFVDPDLDLRRSLAAVNFVSPRGDRFDGFAPDIESSKLADAARREVRDAVLVRAIHARRGNVVQIARLLRIPRNKVYQGPIWLRPRLREEVRRARKGLPPLPIPRVAQAELRALLGRAVVLAGGNLSAAAPIAGVSARTLTRYALLLPGLRALVDRARRAYACARTVAASGSTPSSIRSATRPAICSASPRSPATSPSAAPPRPSASGSRNSCARRRRWRRSGN